GLHLGMAGKIVIGDAEAGEPKPDGPVLSPVWDRVTVHFTDGGALILRDKRRLGRAALDPVIDHLGPDAAPVTRTAARQRRRDGHCPRCGSPMSRATVGGRTTYWCPVDQTSTVPGTL